MPHTRSLPILLLPLVAACAQGRAPGGEAVRDTGDSAAGVHQVTPPAPDADSLAFLLVGTWRLRRDPPQPMPGLRVLVTVDSSSGSRFFGRVTEYFSGNVGVDPAAFAAFSETVDDDLAVSIRILQARSREPGLAMRGRLLGDEIRLDSFVLGPDTLSGTGTRWYLTRER